MTATNHDNDGHNNEVRRERKLVNLNERDFLIRMLYKDCYWLDGILTFYLLLGLYTNCA